MPALNPPLNVTDPISALSIAVCTCPPVTRFVLLAPTPPVVTAVKVGVVVVSTTVIVFVSLDVTLVTLPCVLAAIVIVFGFATLSTVNDILVP